MKKWIAWGLTLICLLGLTGCGDGGSSDNAGGEETGEGRGQETAVPDGQGARAERAQVSVARVYGASGTGAVLSQEDADVIARLLENADWTEETTDCASDCVLTVNEESVHYHAECGTFNADRRSLTLPEEEQAAVNNILGQYITLGFDEIVEETWGVTLTARNVTSTGLTLVCTQSGGAPAGELHTGSPFWLEKNVGGVWKTVPLTPVCVDRTDEDWMIPLDGSVEWKVNFEFLYGTLPAGAYRIGKTIMDFRETGSYDGQDYYAEFEVVE